LAEIRPIYRAKKEAMVAALAKYMPNEEGLRWTNPDGGLFVWVWLPEGVDAEEMLPRAIAHKVAYVPGASSYVDGGGHNTMRLAFSLCALEQIDEGIHRLADVVTETIASCKAGARS
jgi:2-aminoadipate transaminase